MSALGRCAPLDASPTSADSACSFVPCPDRKSATAHLPDGYPQTVTVIWSQLRRRVSGAPEHARSVLVCARSVLVCAHSVLVCARSALGCARSMLVRARSALGCARSMLVRARSASVNDQRSEATVGLADLCLD